MSPEPPDIRDVESFATTLAEDLRRRFPPTSTSRTDRGAVSQLQGILDGIANRALRYQQENKLGIFKKAKLGNVLKWKLRDFGYGDEFSDAVVTQIVTRMAGRR